ncbi:hypothetical protein ACQP1W_48545 [Spirillospora sp. CA-255316]
MTWLKRTNRWSVDDTARALEEIVELPASPFMARAEAARELARLGPPHTDVGVRALEALIAGPGQLDDRVYAAVELGELGADHRVRATAAVRDLITLPPTSSFAVPYAMRRLWFLDPSSFAETVEALQGILSTAGSPAERRHAAVYLGQLAPGLGGELADFLRREIQGDLCGSERLVTIGSLGKLTPAYLDEATAAVRAFLASPSGTPAERRRAAKTLVDLRPDLKEEAAGVLREVIAALREDPTRWSGAAAWLAGHRHHVSTAAMIIVDHAVFDCVDGQSGLSSAALSLGQLGPDHVDESVAVIRSVIASPDSPPLSRAYAGDDLIRLDPAFLEEGTAALEAALTDPGIHRAERIDVAAWLAANHFTMTDRVVGMLRGIIADPARDATERAEAARRLSSCGHGFLQEALTALSLLVDAPGAAPPARAFAAGCLAHLDSSYVLKGCEVVREVVATPGLAASDRVLAASVLADLPLGSAAEAARVLEEVLRETGLGTCDRELAEVLLAEVAPRRLARIRTERSEDAAG